MIITIDGLDGSGKSTLAKRLSKELNYEYIDKPLYELFNVKGDNNYLYKEIYHIQDLIYNTNDSNILKSYFTGLSLLYLKECRGNENLIIDRGLLSAFAFNGDINSKPIFDLLIKYGVFFDLSILLLVSNEERIRRMKKRNINDPDLSTNKILQLRYDSLKEFILLHKDLPILTIDTDYKNEEEIFYQSLEHIKNFENNNKMLKKTI